MNKSSCLVESFQYSSISLSDRLLTGSQSAFLESRDTHELHRKIKLGANASAAAGPVGRDAQASTDVLLNAESLTYSRAKGLFAGLDLSGDVLQANGEDTRAEYGPAVRIDAVLHGAVKTPPNAEHFVHTITRYFIVSKNWKQ
jgi:lipid-binding SYLF domain-containing protein